MRGISTFVVGGPRVRGDDKGVWRIATFAPVRHFAKMPGGEMFKARIEQYNLQIPTRLIGCSLGVGV